MWAQDQWQRCEVEAARSMRLPSKLGDEYEDGNRALFNGKFSRSSSGGSGEPKADEEIGLELNEENIEKVLQEVPACVVGEPSESLELVTIEEPIGKIQFTGPAAGVNYLWGCLSNRHYRRKYYPLQQFKFYNLRLPCSKIMDLS